MSDINSNDIILKKVTYITKYITTTYNLNNEYSIWKNSYKGMNNIINNHEMFVKTIHMWNNIVIDMLEKNIINNDKIWYNEYVYIKNYLKITNY